MEVLSAVALLTVPSTENVPFWPPPWGALFVIVGLAVLLAWSTMRFNRWADRRQNGGSRWSWTWNGRPPGSGGTGTHSGGRGGSGGGSSGGFGGGGFGGGGASGNW